MEPIDTAYQQFLQISETDLPAYADTLHSEADVRMKVIDRFFVEVLGWPRSSIFLEDPAGKGYVDYRCTVDGLSRLIIEAKKDGADLGLTTTAGGRLYKLDGPVCSAKVAREGIEQAVRYCGHKNAELACVTNGREWIIFRGNRCGDGRDTLAARGKRPFRSFG